MSQGLVERKAEEEERGGLRTVCERKEVSTGVERKRKRRKDAQPSSPPIA